MTDRANVKITLTSEVDGEKQEHRLLGEWYLKGRTVFMRYEEKEPESGEVRTIVRWREGELSITRRGDIESEQTFVAGARRPGQYVSPQARFQLETDTSLLWMQCGDMTRGEPADEPLTPTLPMMLEWRYTLWVESEKTGDFIVRLQAERDEDEQ